MTFKKKKNKPDDEEVEQLLKNHVTGVVTLKIVCSPSQRRTFLGLTLPPAHSHPLPPHRTTLTSDCGDNGDHYANGDRLH